MPTSGNCGACAFFIETGPDKGICRRFPPVVLYDPEAKFDQRFVSIFPPMLLGGWCGEFKNRTN